MAAATSNTWLPYASLQGPPVESAPSPSAAAERKVYARGFPAARQCSGRRERNLEAKKRQRQQFTQLVAAIDSLLSADLRGGAQRSTVIRVIYNFGLRRAQNWLYPPPGHLY